MMDVPYQKKAERIAEDLRAQIAGGEYREGDRLPTRADLRSHYNVTSDTLQRALNWLLEEGFVESHGRRGTFVSTRSPHLTRYALLFPNRFLPGMPTNRFFYALYREALERTGERQIDIYDGFSGRAGFVEYESLVEDVRQSRLAGLIFASAPFPLNGTPLLADDGLPRTAMMSHQAYSHIPAVSSDLPALARLAAARFVAAGRRRVAVLLNARLGDDHVEQFAAALRAHDLLPDRDLMVGVNIDRGRWVQTIVRLLFDQPASTRPDALFIADDNLVEPATAALADMGLHNPDDVFVVGSSNFPWAPTSHLPIERIGSSVSQMLQASLDNIDCMRQGRTPPGHTVIAPVHEDLARVAHTTGLPA